MTFSQVRSGLLYLLLTVGSLVVLFPLLYALSLSLQGETVAPAVFPRLDQLDWAVFVTVFQKEPLLLRWIFNSFVVAVAITAGQVLVSVLAAYPLALFRFPGREVFFLVFLATLMIPWEATIIPNYLFIAGMHWKDSYQGMVVPFLMTAFGIFLLRQSFLGIPKELQEAADMEGCGRWRFLWSILVPLCRPALATLAIYGFLNAWNQYYWPLLVIDDPSWRTTQVGISAFRSSEIASFNLQMAATLVVMLPTLLLLWLGQKQLVAGLTAGALKG